MVNMLSMAIDPQHISSAEAQLITRPCARYLEESRNLILFMVRTHELAGAFDQLMKADVVTGGTQTVT